MTTDTKDKTRYKASVIIAVYNHFEWLNLILDALGMQSEKDFEIIIADDGSNEETVNKIREYIVSHSELTIIHSWHPDAGWQKNKALNKAVNQARSNYLIFVDGDCIPHPEFVADHLRLRAPNRIVGGRRVDMSQQISDDVEKWPSLPLNYFPNVRNQILKHSLKDSLGLTLSQLRRTLRFPFFFGRPLGTRPQGFLGCNMGMFKEDLARLNGFDEDYVNPGTGEDTDLELRARNAGMSCLAAPRYALMLHRCHQRLPLDSPENKAILERHRAEGTTRVKNGLIKES